MMSTRPDGQSIRISALLASPHGTSDEPPMQYQHGALVACAGALAYAILRRYRRPSVIGDVPGPANPSWIFGMFPRDNLVPLRFLL